MSTTPDPIEIRVQVFATLEVHADNTVHLVLSDDVDLDFVVSAQQGDLTDDEATVLDSLIAVPGPLRLDSVTVNLTPDTYEVERLYTPRLSDDETVDTEPDFIDSHITIINVEVPK